MKQIFRLWTALLVLSFGAQSAWAETRLALIVGNGSYSSVTQLDNPVHDAALMAQALTAKGFEVTMLTDVGQTALNQGIAQFGRDLRAAGKDATGLFYYAGHAVQSFGENYLLPVDASLTDAADLSLVAVQAEAVLRQMRSAQNKTNIVILDACRNNPFEAIRDLNDNGLAEMKAPTGTFLSYSTAPGAVALDGLDGNSPFTKALAVQINVVGLPIEQTFKRTRIEVIEQTNGRQTPWDTSSLTGDFFFEAKQQLTAQELQEKQLWDSVKVSDDPVQLMLFLRSYPAGRYQEEGRQRLTALLEKELGTGPAAPSDGAAQDTAEPAVPAPKTQDTAAAPEPPAPQTPSASEDELIAAAQSSGSAVDYQAYLDVFPQGTYAELAAFELKIIKEKAERAAAADTPVEPQTQTIAATPETPAVADLSGLTFDTPFPTGGAPIQGLSISEIVELAPMFAPIEGIPEELWKDQTCSNCHEWTKEALCAQGTTYTQNNNVRALSKQHPFGGVFKQGLRDWATGKCK
ncbi:caspase family protein [Sulfitobacter mediterraneus]|uniref:caspase family protein n=1 Tax=Sulfitobacter mediterraneus TaxID=83219 RepID=UPI00193145FB|nr:caspase family protein [Sulfitobacter mediterraneus]MBM1631627.1 caspase family protein [Sulfitobacter mediterraneus]MBM1639442.1 caspase family protein [Sulfitobacter mediterraneus]MBM1643491.1 caspase family protein [Sulfitobacter mediterraneus]MBM1647537.1 caspase family protein [Sulfitobacter mediterraneus]MBM1651582.1 caspase family protein [Sulfitobacter mediterraneus]